MSDDGGPTGAEHRVVFTPSGLSGAVPDGTTVLDAARRLGVDLDSVCGGRAICGRCQIQPAIGSFPKWSITTSTSDLTPWGSIEDDYRGRRPIEAGNRLGCCAVVVGDVVIDVPQASQVHKQVIRKDLGLGVGADGGTPVDPTVALHYVEIAPSDDGAPARDVLLSALEEQWDLGPLTVRAALLGDLHAAVDAGRATAAVRSTRGGAAIDAIWPRFVDRIYGVAFDVGSTTIAGHLCDLATGEILATAGRMNPQIRYGEDLMSRVSYAMMHADGATAMTLAARAALDELVGELVAVVDPGSGDRSLVLDVVAVGNPIMHHLLLGIDPTPLGQAPFPLATADAVETRAEAIGIDAPAAACYVGPCIAGHVGADTTAAMLAEGPHRGDAIQLLVDVGTNAEIVLGNRKRLYAASSPTGPAFEGAQISGGQRATAGAIERVRVDPATLEARFKVIGTDAWSDEPGFAPGSVGVTGICGSGIIEVIAELFLAGVIDPQGTIVGEAATRSDRVEPDDRTWRYRLTESISVTQADVRAVQLAKAALRAGIELLLEHAGLTTVDEVRLAGAFGAHIDPVHAMVLGLVPDCALDRIRSVGNAAGAGAVRALLSAGQRAELEATAGSVIKIETATEPRFQEHFVAALALPHLSAPNPNLAAIVELPERSTEPTPTRRRRRKRPTTADRTS